MCPVSHVTCHMSHVTCYVSHVICQMSIVKKNFKIGRSGAASWWRGCYQLGLPRLVYVLSQLSICLVVMLYNMLLL